MKTTIEVNHRPPGSKAIVRWIAPTLTGRIKYVEITGAVEIYIEVFTIKLRHVVHTHFFKQSKEETHCDIWLRWVPEYNWRVRVEEIIDCKGKI